VRRPLVALALLAACRPASERAASNTGATNTGASASNVVTITATDYHFDAPAEIPAGLTTFRLVNQGHEAHHALLIRLADGKTAADLGAAMKQHDGPLPTWAVVAGGPNAPAPGASTEATIALTPGAYVMLCVIPSADHAPHFSKGMVAPLTVTPATTVAAIEPTNDLTLKLTDYAFDVSAPITAGTHTFRVDNSGSQAHEAVLVRLAPGKSALDLAAWFDNEQGPPPGEPIGGITPISVGQHAYFTKDFTAGRYAWICFWPDAKDGKPHLAHGMIKEFTI